MQAYSGGCSPFDGTAAPFPGISAAVSVDSLIQMGAEDSAHLGDVVIFTLQVLVPVFQAEFPLAGADGRRTCAVAAKS